MQGLSELQGDIDRAIKVQAQCRSQTSDLLAKCIADLQRGCALLEGGGDQADVLRSTKQSVEALKLSAKLASSTKDLHKTVGAVGKGVDKIFTSDISKAWAGQPCDSTLLNQVILEHLYHEGEFEVAATLAAESGIAHAETLREPFVAMHAVLQQIKQRDLGAALEWVQSNGEGLVKADGLPSAFEFEVRRMAFVQLLGSQGRQAALQYARQHFSKFRHSHLPEIQRLMGALCFVNNPGLHNPYADLMADAAWDALAAKFVVQACTLLGQAQDSPLLVTIAAGSASLPTILKLAAVMPMQQTLTTDADGNQQLPVDIPLGREFIFNSIFACPVSREQSTPENPPVLLPCGHCMCKQSILKIAKSLTRSFKCPYCPAETTPLLCKEIIFPPVS